MVCPDARNPFMLAPVVPDSICSAAENIADAIFSVNGAGEG